MVLLGCPLRGKAKRALGADALANDVLEPLEGAAADKQDVGRVDLDEVLVRVLSAALGWDVGDGAFDQLEQRLLDALAGDIACDGGVVALASDLVDLVDVDDAALSARDVEVGGLNQPQQDVLDILADVARLGERGCVGDAKRHIQHLGERLGEQGFAAARRADEQDVGLLQLDVVHLHAGGDALVVVVNGDRQHLFGAILANHVRVQVLVDLGWRRQLRKRQAGLGSGGRG